jgi:hypothetical protein
MYDKVYCTEHHLAAENITTPGKGNDSVPETYLAYCTCSLKNMYDSMCHDVQKGLKIEMSLLMEKPKL